MKRALLATTVLVGLSCPASAVIVVEDLVTEMNTTLGLGQWVMTTANQGRQLVNEAASLANQARQITHALNTFNAVAHGNLYAITRVVPELANLGLVDPLSGDVQELQRMMVGASDLGTFAGDMGNRARSFRQTWQSYVPTGSDYGAAHINAGAASFSAQMEGSRMLMEAASRRARHMQRLSEAGDGTADVKDAMDLNARLSAQSGIGQAQVAQGLGLVAQGQAQAQAQAIQERAAWRASSDQFVTDARAALVKAQAGQVSMFTGSGVRRISVEVPAMDQQAIYSDGAGTMPSDTSSSGASSSGSASGEPTTALEAMTRSYGEGAVQRVSSFGVDPNSVAAICMAESGCRNMGAHSSSPGQTAGGGFGYTNGTFTAEARAAGYDPSSGRYDGALQAELTARSMRTAAQTLQRTGIDTPTALDVYGFHMFGAGKGVAAATADDSTPVAAALGLSPQAIAQNNLAGRTMGQWRASVRSRMGAAADRPVLV